MRIPLSKPDWGRQEERAVVRAMRKWIGTGDGPNVAVFEKMLRQITGAKHSLAVTSCTHAMELSVKALGVKTGNEVVMPSFTMTSTANAVVLAGGVPVFADIEETTLNIDPKDILRKITSRTVGIMVVHYAGAACRMEEIIKIAKRNGLWIIEDAAHAIGSSYRGRPLGTWGDIGCFSFHGTKNIATGEGGAIVTDNKKLADFMEVYRANGTNRKAFLEGAVDKYSWVAPGSSYFLSDILAAIGREQLVRLEAITRKRRQIAHIYQKTLLPFTGRLFRFQEIINKNDTNYHIFPLLFFSENHRRDFQTGMKKQGIETPVHYVPLHQSEMGRKLPQSGRLPVTEKVAKNLVRLPIYPGLSKKEISFIINTARNILSKIK